MIASDDEMGGRTDLYTWGQNENEVSIKCRLPAGIKARHVKLDASSQKLKVAVCGQASAGAAARPR